MYSLNPGQDFIVNQAVNWYYYSQEQLFQYDGPPGSGKSFVLNEIITRLGLDPLTEVASMSYTGAASLVMRTKGLYNASTIHSWLYQIIEQDARDKDGKIIMDNLLNIPVKTSRFIPVDYLDPSIKLIVVDEGGSVPLHMRQQILKFGVKVLVCGDPRQLPPVGDEPAFLTANENVYHLTQVMRQTGRDDIIYIANRADKGLPLLNGYYGNCLVIDKQDLTDNMLLWADQVICCKNATRDTLNRRIRHIKGYHSNLPSYGEKVVCRNNNWAKSIDFDNGTKINLVNGLVGTVTNSPDISGFDGKMFTMSFAPDLLQGEQFRDLRCNYKYMISDFETRKAIKNNKYEVGELFEFAYAITCHIAQGGQWHNVVYIEEYMHKDIQNALNLVGASRADTSLIFVKK